MKTCRLWLAKEEIEKARLPGATVIVIDVLLATTTLIDLMERGAHAIYPVDSVEAALEKKRLLRANAITGGELGGQAVAEFDYGHLPEHYSDDLLQETELVFLSTNGTKAIQGVKTAERRVLANLRNVYALANWIQQQEIDDLIIVCAGAGGHMAMEDSLCASLLIEELSLDSSKVRLNDAALYASKQTTTVAQVKERTELARVGRYMRRSGMGELLDFTVDVGASNALVEVNDEDVLVFLEGE